MARRQRSFTTFNLSFLDIMSCGFGAVVLVFLIIDHSMAVHFEDLNKDLVSEVNLLEGEVLEGKAGLVRLRNTLSDVDQQTAEARGRATRISEELDEYEALIASLRAEGYTEDEAIEKLQAEIQSLEEEVRKLREAAPEDGGRSARTFVGEGNRQYLTGLNLGGRNIAILLDVSASMLADRLVNIIRLRNMDESVQRRADKWTRAINTVDWLTAQLPVNAEYQVITFNTDATTLLGGTGGEWLEVADQAQLEQVSSALRKIVPAGGTSLENAFIALQRLSPSPDNIFLITDGLPTQGTSPPRGSKVSGRDRQRLYRQAIRQLPAEVPVNVILAPMEGDPMAASEFWQLAQVSKGSFLSPSRDWP
ncbi:VWA domain-containing protein [Seongchinamella sediminis]|uniref:VWA domain-containing protein n=1 Tax=Seongchinamella sediminis TaxID=2283635 RepID=A0A3L7E091_9GAMM|nr:vWA domain-containing protein [Seongchinamella sediminis]RLQ22335.1 VWA domain-containing protein [Seongchinamella sediminis]